MTSLPYSAPVHGFAGPAFELEALMLHWGRAQAVGLLATMYSSCIVWILA